MTFRDSEAGLTLIEVLVSLALVMAMFTVLLVSVSAGVAKVREAERDTAAIAWVQGAMEAAYVAGVDELPPTGRYDPKVLANAPALPPGFLRAEIAIRVMSVKPLLKEVTVQIYHPRTGRAPAFALSTLVGPRLGP